MAVPTPPTTLRRHEKSKTKWSRACTTTAHLEKGKHFFVAVESALGGNQGHHPDLAPRTKKPCEEAPLPFVAGSTWLLP